MPIIFTFSTLFSKNILRYMSVGKAVDLAYHSELTCQYHLHRKSVVRRRMGASASIESNNGIPLSPRVENGINMDLIARMSESYKRMKDDDVPDEAMFERMKTLCTKAYADGSGKKFCRRASDASRKKREVIFGKGLDIASDAGLVPKRPSEHKSAETMAILKKALQSILFTGSSNEDFDKVLFIMQRLVVEPGEYVIKQGDIGDQFFIVQSGTLDAIVNNSTVGQLSVGDHFGELALIYDAPRAATIQAVDKSVLWSLDREEFRMMQARSSNNSLAKRAKWLRQVDILATLSQRQLAILASVLQAVTFEKGEQIIKQGDVGDTFYIVEEGLTSCRIDVPGRSNEGEDSMQGIEIARFGPGDYFGEMALLSDVPRNASVYAIESVKCLTMERQEFDSMLGPLTELLDTNSRIRILRMFPFFSEASTEDLSFVVSQLEIKVFHDSQCIFKEGDVATTFYIVKSGCVKLIEYSKDANTGQKVSRESLLKANDTFGVECLDQVGSYTSTAVSCGRSQCQWLKLGNITRSGKRQFTQKMSNYPTSAAAQYSSIRFEDLRTIGILGEGSFGRVALVHTSIDGEMSEPMAMKVLAKSHVVETDQMIQVKREKEALSTLPYHPFIVELYNTYQDYNYLYLLMEFIQGGELFTLLRNEEFIETVDEAAVRFYSANVILGLQHMHRYDTVYRDLKPENLVINKQGYLKFVDFGFAKKIPFTIVNSDGVEELHSRTYTLCGTLEYLAPELVLNTGHDLAVDNWSLGILIYEMLVGYTPFSTPDGDTNQLFRNVAMVRTGANAVDFPFHLLENCPNACDLVRRLLQGDPTKRIGVGINGDQDLRQHPWFSRIEWEKLYAMQLEPPYLPPLEGKFDLSLFEGELGNRAKDRPFDGNGQELFADF